MARHGSESTRGGGAVTLLQLFAWPTMGFAIAAIAGGLLLPLLTRFQFHQHAYEDAPPTHQSKTGTPTMGGIVFVLALLPLLAAAHSALAQWLFVAVAGCAAIGFIDDSLGVRFGRNRGLRARTKFLASALVAVWFLYGIDAGLGFYPRDVLVHLGSFALVVPHWLWLILGMLAITGTIHAVNLTDGLDGLASGTMLPPLAAVASIAMLTSLHAAAFAALLGIGACVGFLLYNRHPAKLFMGDTGSLALGALLSTCAILEGEMLLLLVIGGVFVAEALSVMLQVSYFKLTQGKRILRMSPLHHHFELGGMSEVAVTQRFWLFSLLCAMLGWALVVWA